MNWEPQDKPGYAYLEAHVGEKVYVIQKRDGSGISRLFMKRADHEALRTIFIGASLAECMEYADIYEGGQSV